MASMLILFRQYGCRVRSSCCTVETLPDVLKGGDSCLSAFVLQRLSVPHKSAQRLYHLIDTAQTSLAVYTGEEE